MNDIVLEKVPDGVDAWTHWRQLRQGTTSSRDVWFIAERAPEAASWPAEVRPLLQPFYQSGKQRFAVGRIPDEPHRITALARAVHRLRGLSPVQPQLEHALTAARVFEPDRPWTAGRQRDVKETGQGVLVGFIDNGCAFAHPRFRNANGASRVQHLWDQRDGISIAHARRTGAPAGFTYGSEIDTDLGGQSLPSADDQDGWRRFYEERGYPLLEAEGGEMKSLCWTHGTHVMDAAVGGGEGAGPPHGVAPGADIAFVQLPEPSWASPHDIRGASVHHLLDGVNYIFERAENRPCVVNISYSGRAGPHDGSSLIEKAFDEVLSRHDRAIVMSAGNAATARGHICESLGAGGRPHSIRWSLAPGDRTPNVVELWYRSDAQLAVSVREPGIASDAGSVPAGHYQPVVRNGAIGGYIIHARPEPGATANCILIGIDPGLAGAGEAGTTLPSVLKIELHNVGAVDTDVHAWIERDDFLAPHGSTQSWFPDAGASPARFTLGGFCTGQRPLVVGALHAGPAGPAMAPYSSRGPTLGTHGAVKPDISAVASSTDRAGMCLTRALSTKRRPVWGTSVAAPIVSGTVALLYEVALEHSRSLSVETLRQLLHGTASPVPGGSKDAVGAGAVNAADAIRALRQAISGG